MSCNQITKSNDIEDILNNNTYKFSHTEENEVIIFKCIYELLDITTIKEYNKKLIQLKRKYKINLRKSDLFYYYRKQPIKNLILEKCLVKAPSRSQHGVIVISVIMGPHKFSCKHNCSFCPTYPEYAKSYIPEEPTVQRGERNNFSGELQLKERVYGLINNGHQVDKLEVIILGGTFSCYPPSYATQFINELYYGANTIFDGQNKRPMLDLENERILNENTKCKIIGLTLETRPDYITFYELHRFRRYGCTRVQLGIQTTDDYVLKKNNRECFNKDSKKAIQLLLDNCFKVDIHIMPDLPFSSYMSDIQTMYDILYDESFYADQYKIYPTMVTENTEIKKWYDEGSYVPRYEKNVDDLINLCIYFKSNVARNKRINRLIRDFSTKFIEGGTKTPHLRQVIQDKMRKQGLQCKCIRCREVKNNYNKSDKVYCRVYHEKASGGDEYFLSYETCNCKFCYKHYLFILRFNIIRVILFFTEFFLPIFMIHYLIKYMFWNGCDNESKCYGFLRLRFPSNKSKTFKELKDCALIRELHIYGNVNTTYMGNNEDSVQHNGYGSKLMRNSLIFARVHNYRKIAVISGDGVKNYYRNKFGFYNEGHFLVKDI